MNDLLLTDRLREHADQTPEKVAISYLCGDGTIEELSFGMLHQRVQAMAACLSTHIGRNRVACLVYPPTIDFAVTFLACLAAGIVAVPCPPPSQKRRGNQLSERFLSVCRHAQPELVLTDEDLCERLATGPRDDVMWRLLATNDLDLSESFHEPRIAPSSLAFIQYTSGSTAAPKGVMVSHANLVANERAIQTSLQHDKDTVLVNWLPLFHDMGLVCGLLQPLFVGCQSVLLPHTSFASDPIQWLETITRFRGTSTGGPNISYELCVDRITDERKEHLDLSTLRVAFNGAEPVLPSTMRRFSDSFEACGFRRRAFFPCFGMAEATLMISGGPVFGRRQIVSLTRSQMGSELASKTPLHGSNSIDVVGCGLAAPETEIVIVNPDSREKLAAGHVGEIWVRGASIAAGYFRDKEATLETFRASPKGSSRQYLRTGDLGLLDQRGELFVTGRLKELIIVAGRNLYPHDVEEVVRRELNLGRKYRIAAFGLPSGGTEELAVLIECDGHLRALARKRKNGSPQGLHEVTLAVQRTLSSEFGVTARTIGYAKPGSVPVTSSGKIRRQASRDLLQSEPTEIYHVAQGITLRSESFQATQNTVDQVTSFLSDGGFSNQANTMEGVDESTSLEELGLDSLATTSLVSEIERHFHIRIDTAEVTPRSSLGQLTGLVAQATRPDRAQPNGIVAPSQHSHLKERKDSEMKVDSKVTSLTDFADRESEDLFEKTREFQSWYRDAEERGFKRYLLPVKEQRGGRALVGRDSFSPECEVVLFGSADYLGLAHDGRVKEAAATAIRQGGCNVASVPLVAGSTPIHKKLEERLANLLSMEACVLFPTGHSANLATIATLCSKQDTVVVDNRVHYSILEGVRLAQCPWQTFAHNEPDQLESVLERIRDRNPTRGILVALEGVYGIEGDLPDLDSLVSIARRYGARVLLDDAHGIGVLGPRGEGTAAYLGASENADIVMGSLSKALGSFGGFIAGPRGVVDYLRFYAKAISFAVGLPTVNAAAALAGLKIIDEEPFRLRRLLKKAEHFRSDLMEAGFHEVSCSRSPIVSLTVGCEETLREITKDLYSKGIWAEGLPFPAVSRGQERLRFRIRDLHEIDDLDLAVQATQQVFRKHLGRRHTQIRSVSNPGLRWQNTSNLTRKQADEVYDLATRMALENDSALPWVSREFVTKYFTRASYWKALKSEHAWHLLYEDRQLKVAFCLDKTKVQRDGVATHVGLLGPIFCGRNLTSILIERLRALAKLISSVELLVSPASCPVPVFGAGMQSWKTTQGKPFLETEVPKELEQLLRDSTNSSATRWKSYYRLMLNRRPSNSKPSPHLRIRDFERAKYVEETREFIAPIFGETIAQLDLCSPIPAEVLVGLTRDLREFMMPGFWRLAEWDQQPAGFVFCYPNITDEFKRIGGDADVADFQRIHDSMENAREAFIAWLAVAPAFANKGIAEALLNDLHCRLIDRGYTHLWMSWEFVDGRAQVSDYIGRLGQLLRHVKMPYIEQKCGAFQADSSDILAPPIYPVQGKPVVGQVSPDLERG